MKIRTVNSCIRDGFKSVFRNGLMSLASVGTISAVLIIFGIVYCLVMNVRSFTNDLDKNLGIVAFLNGQLSHEEIDDISKKLDENQDIASWNYVSSDEAWKDFKSEMLGDSANDSDLVEQLDNDNPLKNSANFEVYAVSAEKQQQVVDFLKSFSQIRKISYSANASRTLASFAKLVTYVGGALILFLIFVALLLITNTIRVSVYTRRNEISIMKYIGATDSFVRLPFLVEGILIGFLGAILPTALVFFGYNALVKLMAERFSSISQLFTFLSLGEIMHGLLPIFLILSIVVGALGSTISIRRHLKV